MRQVMRTAGTRIDALDAARFLALAGMMCTHLWLVDENGLTPPITAVLSGKASALFAVLAGAGIALTSHRALERGRARAARLNLLGRGLALIVIGLTLGISQPDVLVILAFYGVMFLLAMPFLRMRARALVIIAVIWAIAWPICSHVLRGELLGVQDHAMSPEWLLLVLAPGDLVLMLLLTGAYPAMTWLPYILLGLAIGKALLARRDAVSVPAERDEPERSRASATPDEPVTRGPGRLPWWLLGAGSAVALIAFLLARLVGDAEARAVALTVNNVIEDPAELAQLGREELEKNAYGVTDPYPIWRLFATGPHTGTPPDLLITGGIAAAIIGLCLLLLGRLGPRARLALAPVLGAGAAPLTVYSAHVIGIVIIDQISTYFADSTSAPLPVSWWLIASGPGLWALHVVLALVLGFVLRLAGVRGPLEALVSQCGRLLARLAPGTREPSS